MMLTTVVDGLPNILRQVANPAVRALALAVVVGLALAAFRVRTASLRLFTWTAVLYTALAMPLLGRMLPPLTLSAPAVFETGSGLSSHREVLDLQAPAAPLPSSVDASVERNQAKRTSSETNQQISQPSLASARHPLTALPLVAAASPSHLWSHRLSSIRWGTVATGIYLSIALLLLARFVVGLFLARRLTKASQPIRDSRVTLKLSSFARAGGLSLIPRVAESEFISVPVTVGAFRSSILLPAGWREWDDAKLDAVIAHEGSHVRRRDALTQRLSLLHRAVFWFSPLAWWLDRQLANLAEQASDEAALSCGTDRNDYARTLLGFFEALQAAPGRVWWQGVSMAKAGQVERRLERILDWKGAVTVGLKNSIALAIIALAIPLVYLAASVRPAQDVQDRERAQTQTPTPAQNATAAAPATEADAPPEAAVAPELAPPMPPAPAAGVPGGVSGPGPIAPVAPGAPVAPVAPSSAWAGQYLHRYSHAYDYDDEERFVIVTGGSDSLTMSGSSEDARHAEKLRKQIPGDFIWFERDEKSYIIRDQATVDRARKLWLPQEELGKKQEALGKQQEALGKQQQALGERMQQIQVKVPDMSAELDKLRAELKQLSSGATVEQVGRIQSEIGELQSKIGQVQSHAGEEQSKLGEEMGALGEKQGKLGEQQAELGRQQGEVAQAASRQMKELLDEAIKKGTAQPEPQTGGTASL